MYENKERDNGLSGFTLVELIVVIVVLGILAAIGIPRYNKYVNEGRLAHIQSDMKTISGLIEVTAMDDDGIYRGDFVDDLSELEKAITEGRAYKEGNLLLQEDYAGGDFHVIKDPFIKSNARSKLKGTFLVDGSDNVYYVANKKLKGGQAESSNDDIYDENGCLKVDLGKMIPINVDFEFLVELQPEQQVMFGKTHITIREIYSMLKEGEDEAFTIHSYSNSYYGGKTYYAFYKDSGVDEPGGEKFNMTIIHDLSLLFNGILGKDDVLVISFSADNDNSLFTDGDENLFPKYIQDIDEDGNLISCPRLLKKESNPDGTGEGDEKGTKIDNCGTTIFKYSYNDISDTAILMGFTDEYREENPYASNKGTLIIPETVVCYQKEYVINEIGNNAFSMDYYSKNSINELTLSNNITKIGEGAFKGNGLRSLSITDSVQEIAFSAFHENSITSLIIPDTVKVLGQFSFGGNRISSLSIGTGLTEIGHNAFKENRLTSVVIPGNIKEIGLGSFGDNLLTSIIFNEGLEKIWTYAFDGNQLSSIHLPNSLLEIGEGVFANNASLINNKPNTITKIEIGENVTIGPNMLNWSNNNFRDCYYGNGKKGRTYIGSQEHSWHEE